MINDMNIELSDEQLAEVTGGSSSKTSVFQLANNFTNQGNFVDGSTNVFAVGGGKQSTNEFLVRGSSNNVGNTSVSLNSLS